MITFFEPFFTILLYTHKITNDETENILWKNAEISLVLIVAFTTITNKLNYKCLITETKFKLIIFSEGISTGHMHALKSF